MLRYQRAMVRANENNDGNDNNRNGFVCAATVSDNMELHLSSNSSVVLIDYSKKLASSITQRYTFFYRAHEFFIVVVLFFCAFVSHRRK